MARMNSTRWSLVALTAAVSLTAVPVDAQYFGRNKVQYDDFEWSILPTPHFDIHFYTEEDEAIEDIARMSERWYERLARSFQHEFEEAKPLIMYSDHPDFQQTNTLSGQVSEGTGGVTESLKNRVIMPMSGSYADTDHVLGHELVHAFQYNIAQSGGGAGFRGLVSLPLWLVEGMAEYLSVGRDDPLTAMWLRDAIRRDDFPTIRDLSTNGRFFPYRFGQALWAYVGGTYGDDVIYSMFRSSIRVGFEPAIGQILALDSDTLSAQWRREIEGIYGPLMEGRTAPDSLGTLILDDSNAGNQNVSPSLSPDGRYIAFLSEKDLFSIDLFLADARTGRVIRKLSSADSNPHADALRFVDAAGTWSPDGEQFAYVVFSGGDNEINIIDVESGNLRERLRFDGIGAINNPAWSPDGTRIAFSGMQGGFSDLYVYDIETEQLDQLTRDKHADAHPAWSADGLTLAFATDRGPETDFNTLVYSSFRIATIDVGSRQIQVLDLLGNARHSSPQYTPDGNRLLFVSDADGFSDVYALDLRSGGLERLTKVQTGVSGITSMSPALSVAAQTGEIAVSVFDNFGFQIHSLPANTPGEPVREIVADVSTFEGSAVGRALPPSNLQRASRVASYLDDPSTGLEAEGAFRVENATPYESKLSLDALGQPSVGIGTDRFGSYASGGASAFFSDMLGNRELGVAVQAQGSLKDIGAQAVYTNRTNRLNWSVSGGRLPLLYFRQGFGTTPPEEGAQDFFSQQRIRIYQNSLNGRVEYPLSSTRRLEAGLGATRYGYDVEEDRFILDDFGRVVDFERVDRPDLEFDAVNLGSASIAYVGDNSIFGFTSPIRGGRFRIELEQSFLDETFTTAILDFRRYASPTRNLTFAARGLHIGRYGNIERNSIIQPLFMGFESLVRGYASESFSQEECRISTSNEVLEPRTGNPSTCAAFDRLFGQRLGLFNLEARVPFLGVDEYGLISFPFIPTELSVFMDGGLAWDDDTTPRLEFSTERDGRIPVFSTGFSARMNILGILIFEAYYAYPFQRPDKGWHWGFNIAPGW